ncbi:sugar phosphate nucleotidyltransferase, partial [Celeribacter persicus]|uniref:sugar phosphate nucleotidyltransferase n=1 Tax=Celeribacter persicus TaxID=1651082 RepID=UPI003CCBB271
MRPCSTPSARLQRPPFVATQKGTQNEDPIMLTPVILCGGSGTRLWPLSRRSYPKQFVPLMG